MKMTAAAVVSWCKKLAGPRLPKTVWLEPPKAAPMLAPLPVWSRMMAIRARETITWRTRMNINIRLPFVEPYDGRKALDLKAGPADEGSVNVLTGHQVSNVVRLHATTI